jgi:c(7)-type cytochrome triheme protein
MKRRDLRVPAAVFAATLALSCGVARAFLDLPPPTPERDPQAVAQPERAPGSGPSIEEAPPPPIEAIPPADSVLELLPRDRAGGVDWVRAVAEGVIRPRSHLPGAVGPQEPESGYDFYLKGAGPEAYFPHSTHTYWIGCRSCHPAIYRYRGDSVSTRPGHGGDSCGTCHGKVAFSAQTCERCHAEFGSMMPPDRLPPLPSSDALILRVVREAVEDSTETAVTDEVPPGEPVPVVSPEADAPAPALDEASLYPPVRFDHWVHRIRFRCRACHPEPFAMRAGGTGLTQETAHGTSTCGRCHNGAIAFAIGVTDCNRCHRDEPAEPP